MSYMIEFEIEAGYKLPFDGVGINVEGTSMACEISEFKAYIESPDAKHYAKVEEWIDTELMPHMTLKNANYTSWHSGMIARLIEQEIGEYVSNEEVKYILALKGIKGANRTERYPYKVNLYYPLKKSFFNRKMR